MGLGRVGREEETASRFPNSLPGPLPPFPNPQHVKPRSQLAWVVSAQVGSERVRPVLVRLSECAAAAVADFARNLRGICVRRHGRPP